MKVKNIVLRAITMLFSLLMFVPMLSWVTAKAYLGKQTTTKSLKISEVTSEFLKGSESASMMSLAKGLFYVVFVLAIALIVLEILRFFIKDNKIVELVTKLVVIAILVLGFLVLLFSFIWCNANSKTTTIAGNTVGGTFLPWFGGAGVLLFGIMVCIFGLLDLKKQK